MDVLPTLMALVDINWRVEKSSDGIDWSPLLLSSSPTAERVARELTLVDEAPTAVLSNCCNSIRLKQHRLLRWPPYSHST